MSNLAKSTDFKMVIRYDEFPPLKYTGSHIELGYNHNGILNSYIKPIPYILGFEEGQILKDGTYQLYSHTLLPHKARQLTTTTMKGLRADISWNNLLPWQTDYQKSAYIYVGITKQTWQKRYQQHNHDALSGSVLRFHRALRDEFFKIGVIEHIVERAGLTENEAMLVEETEIERRSLHSIFPKGLNMIPGGYAGFKCIHQYAKRVNYPLPKSLSADILESVLVEIQKKNLEMNLQTTNIHKINELIAKYWAEDINFRINAMTSQHNRFSFRQIQAARIWYASGWTIDKIFENLRSLEPKELNRDQLERLLNGETYHSIPDVLFDE
jgi:hypothetical protein